MVVTGSTVVHVLTYIRDNRLGLRNHCLGFRDHCFGIRNCHVGIDSQFGLEWTVRFANARKSQSNAH